MTPLLLRPFSSLFRRALGAIDEDDIGRYIAAMFLLAFVLLAIFIVVPAILSSIHWGLAVAYGVLWIYSLVRLVYRR